ncbi:HAD-IA family hydrolase [Piscinibacter sp. Jin2]|uniref:HAD-IA family hydrolase n=1 Tax=Aquariibacter lacus TaxID=2801332 RepID=A0A9X0XFP4_9BURK|nr:HAD-IA family hydrolase [Piscinibacter lacus]MBL0720101.1 HAD-IA family hydrolase [Piscinibacter lacus]
MVHNPPGGPAPAPLDPRKLQALSLDLDDTLWPIAPTLARAEQALADWLVRHAPATAAAWPPARMLALRQRIGQAHPELAHDLSALRLKTLDQALREAGEDPALAGPAFDVFFAARQRVELLPGVAETLDRLAARWPLYALSNGNADLVQTGIARWFRGSLSAREAGVAKPHPQIFQQACARLGSPPAAVLHIGDDLHADVLGARAAGLRAAWLRPAHRADPAQPACWQGEHLPALGDWLLAA